MTYQPLQKPEPYLAPKELADALNAAGVRGPGGHAWNLRGARQVVHAIRSAGLPVVLRHYVRASDAAALIATGWKPFAKPRQ